MTAYILGNYPLSDRSPTRAEYIRGRQENRSFSPFHFGLLRQSSYAEGPCTCRPYAYVHGMTPQPNRLSMCNCSAYGVPDGTQPPKGYTIIKVLGLSTTVPRAAVVGTKTARTSARTPSRTHAHTHKRNDTGSRAGSGMSLTWRPSRAIGSQVDALHLAGIKRRRVYDRGGEVFGVWSKSSPMDRALYCRRPYRATRSTCAGARLRGGRTSGIRHSGRYPAVTHRRTHV